MSCLPSSEMLSSIHLFVQVDATKATDGMKDPVQLNLVLGTQKKIMRHEIEDLTEFDKTITLTVTSNDCFQMIFSTTLWTFTLPIYYISC